MKVVQTGIWLDFRDAYLISFDEEKNSNVIHIHSNVTHPATKGGHRSKTRWGPQYAPPDSNNLERAKHEEHHYFQEILKHIDSDIEDIVIFGPAEAKIGLKKEIESIKHFHPRLRAVLPSDYMTQNEMVALFRNFFENPQDYLREKEEAEESV